MAKKALVLGAGGFIGTHLVKRLRDEGYYVRGVDLKHPEFSESQANEFLIGDLRDPKLVELVIEKDFSEIYQLAADMGGAEYIFTGQNDAQILNNSAQINLNVGRMASERQIKKIFYSSSACVYPFENQSDLGEAICSENTAYPANPDSNYGWEKLFSERLYFAYLKNHGLNVKVARFHNVFGPLGTWRGGREKAPAAICRKVAEASSGRQPGGSPGGYIEIWGDGRQTRSFLFIEECLEGIRRFMNSEFNGPLNIGSDEMVGINELATIIIEISGKNLEIKNIDGPVGVRGRCSDNRLIREKLGWAPTMPLKQGLVELYKWVEEQVRTSRKP